MVFYSHGKTMVFKVYHGFSSMLLPWIYHGFTMLSLPGQGSEFESHNPNVVGIDNVVGMLLTLLGCCYVDDVTTVHPNIDVTIPTQLGCWTLLGRC